MSFQTCVTFSLLQNTKEDIVKNVFDPTSVILVLLLIKNK